MKIKIITILLSLVFSVAYLSAQDSTMAKQEDRGLGIPGSGDVMIALDATPFLNFAGNMFNGENFNSFNLNSTTLYGKYFLSQSSALRFVLSINHSNSTDKYYVTDDAAIAMDPLSTKKVTDIRKTKDRNWFFSAGYEIRKPYKKFVGFYGGNVGYNYIRNTTEYTYGNPMSDLNPNPSTYMGNLTSRPTYDDSGVTHVINLGGLAGVEYYFMKHACIGGEIGLNISYRMESQSDTKYEEWDGSKAYEFDEINDPGDNYLNINTLLPYTYGGLYLGFYF